MAFDLADILPALPEIILSAVALMLVLVAAFGGDGAANARRVAHLTLVGIALAALALLSITSAQSTAFGGMFRADAFANYMKLLVLMGSFAAVFMSVTPLERDDINKPEFSLLVILALVGMMLMISANDLISLYMAVSCNHCRFMWWRQRTTRSLFRSWPQMFLLGALSSGMLLYGASLVYGLPAQQASRYCGCRFKDRFTSRVYHWHGVYDTGMAFKVSAAPFHMWTPDVYEGSPSPVTTLLRLHQRLRRLH